MNVSVAQRALDRAEKAHEIAVAEKSWSSTHEELCALRYQGIIDRLGKLEHVVYWAAGILITAMGSLLTIILVRGH
jgi:hypothetical protein